MKKFVYLFGALLLFFSTQNNLAGDDSEDNDFYNFDFFGRGHDKIDHKRLNFGPIRASLNVNYLRSTSAYDIDGNKKDYNGGDIYTRFNEILYAKYHGGKIGDTKLHWGASAEFSFIQTKWKPGDMNMYGVEQSNNGFTITPGLNIGTRRLGDIRLGTRLAVKYQYDGTKDESDATDKQNALGVNLNFNYKICHSSKAYVGLDYWKTFAATETQFYPVYNPETNQYENAETDYDFDSGDQFAIYGGTDYKWCWGDCGWGYADLKLNYWTKSDQSYNGETIDKTGANYLSVIPKVGFRWKNIPLNVSVSAGYKNEYGIEQGMIGLSGKNVRKPSLALQAYISYSF